MSRIVAQRIVQSMTESLRLRGHTFRIKLSIGISSYPEHASFTGLYNAAKKAPTLNIYIALNIMGVLP